VDANAAGNPVILVRIETSPDDVHGMLASKGVLTARGGATSHAAVVARSMGLPCTAGAESLKIDYGKRLMRVGSTTVREGEMISIDGTTGEIFLGELPTIEARFEDEHDLATLLSWADELLRTSGFADAWVERLPMTFEFESADEYVQIFSDVAWKARMASLAPADFGRLVDPYGGRADLEARVLRVLHNLSFIDDPTRIFRAVRYEARYGLRLDEHSARLARGCIEMGLVGDLSSARLRDELVALLEDPGAVEGILRLGALGADRAVHAHLRADEQAAKLFGRALALRDELALEVPAWRLGLAVLGRELSSDEAYDWLERVKVRRRDVEQVVGAIAVSPRILERLRAETLDPAQVVALTERYAPDAPLLALAHDELPELRDYFTRLRDVRLEIDGSDLAELGLGESPRVGEVLAELRRRKLNGELDGRESELAAARALLAAAIEA